MRSSQPLEEMQAHMSDFKSYQEIRMRMGGWFKKGQTPPVVEPPESMDWVRGNTRVAIYGRS